MCCECGRIAMDPLPCADFTIICQSCTDTTSKGQSSVVQQSQPILIHRRHVAPAALEAGAMASNALLNKIIAEIEV